MTSASRTLIATALGVTLIAASANPPSRPSLIWNASASVPVGLYRVSPARTLSVGDIVVVRPPEKLAGYLDRRQYLPRGVPLLKHVAGLPGEVICRRGAHVTIDGTLVGDALPRDRRGRSLPQWQGCLTLAIDQVFLLNADRPDSFDGRYFGPLPLNTIAGRAAPIWLERSPS